MPRRYSESYLRKKRRKPIGLYKKKVRGKRKKVTVPIMARRRRVTRVATGKGTQTTYKYRCCLCGKAGTSRNMTYRKELGYVHRKCMNRWKDKMLDWVREQQLKQGVAKEKDLSPVQRAIIGELLREGEVYSPREGLLKTTDYEQTKPQTFPKKIGKYVLQKSIKRNYAWYEHDVGFGFKQGLEIGKVWPENRPEKTLVRVCSLSSTASLGKSMKPRWLVIRDDYFYNMEDAIGHLTGETRVYKPKKKPEVIRPLTEQQIRTYFE